MGRKREWEYVEGQTTKTEKWKDQMCFSYSQLRKHRGGEEEMQQESKTGFKSMTFMATCNVL